MRRALAKPSQAVTMRCRSYDPPKWLKFKPDFRYLTGALFPPVVPNVIDIRTISIYRRVQLNNHPSN